MFTYIHIGNLKWATNQSGNIIHLPNGILQFPVGNVQGYMYCYYSGGMQTGYLYFTAGDDGTVYITSRNTIPATAPVYIDIIIPNVPGCSNDTW